RAPAACPPGWRPRGRATRRRRASRAPPPALRAPPAARPSATGGTPRRGSGRSAVRQPTARPPPRWGPERARRPGPARARRARAGDAAGTARRRIATACALALWVLGLDAWFHGPIFHGHLSAPAALLLLLASVVVALTALRAGGGPRLTRGFAVAAAVVCVLATVVRLPALAAPGSLISSDSAVAGIIAQELRAGQLPPPIYAPGFPYEGTLKAQLTALLGRSMAGVGTPLLYAVCSHLFYLIWTVAVMLLARDVGGIRAALGAGLFMAVPPRFLMAFSLNNVGQYPEVNA